MTDRPAKPEDSPPSVVPRHYPEHAETIPPESYATSEEQTRPDIKSPLPQKLDTKQTQRLTPEQREELERQVYAHEHKRLAEALEMITATLPKLATKAELEFIKEKLESFDAGIRGNSSVIEAVGQQVSRLGNDIRTWLFGDAERDGLGQEVGALRDRVDSALGAITKLPPRLAAIEARQTSAEDRQTRTHRVACGTWMQVTTGEIHVAERRAIDEIVVQDSTDR